MRRCRYLIVGGGPAADAAVRGIREKDPLGSIFVVSEENDPPYNRPFLSKSLWRGSRLETIWRHTQGRGVTLCLGTRIALIDPPRRRAFDDKGTTYCYKKLLLATGGSPRRLGEADPSVIYFRHLCDFRRAWKSAAEQARFAVIGGGLLGPELAASLAMNGRQVSLVTSGTCIGARIYPRPLANFLNVYFRRRGVDLLIEQRVEAVERRSNELLLRTNRNNNFSADVVIVAIGIEPNLELASRAGLRVGNGIIVDEGLRTSDPYIFAAGDVANFPSRALHRRLRCEHADSAESMGRLAGRNMAGGFEPYRYLPSFSSDLFDLSYEAVGEIDSTLEIIADWEQRFIKGIVYYVRAGRVRGVMFWNTPGLTDAARELISADKVQPDELLRASLYDPKASADDVRRSSWRRFQTERSVHH